MGWSPWRRCRCTAVRWPKEFVEQSLPSRVLSYLQAHISRERLEGVYRRRNWDYPKEVIRELLVNAFAHRDWTRPTDVQLTVFADRLEVQSPGSLPNGVTIEKAKEGLRVPRNPNIVNILRDYDFMEHRGMGIRRKVIPADPSPQRHRTPIRSHRRLLQSHPPQGNQSRAGVAVAAHGQVR